MGRPSKYESNVKPKLNLVTAWARDGLTNEQIAKNLDISVDSLYEYQKNYAEFSDALKIGKEEIDIQVENALLKAALGYEYEEEQATKDGVYTVKKYAHPNTTALIFWLKNRKPQTWRDKHELEHSGEVEIKVSLPSNPFGDKDGDG